jgi:hypothetical protein
MIEIQQPRALDLVGSPVQVAGQSLVFEANIEWRSTLAGAIAEGFFTGGGSVAVRQFQSSLDLSPLLSVAPSKEALKYAGRVLVCMGRSVMWLVAPECAALSR